MGLILFIKTLEKKYSKATKKNVKPKRHKQLFNS
jgi:hypothetical protein